MHYLVQSANRYAHASVLKHFMQLVGLPLKVVLHAQGIGGREGAVHRLGCMSQGLVCAAAQQPVSYAVQLINYGLRWWTARPVWTGSTTRMVVSGEDMVESPSQNPRNGCGTWRWGRTLFACFKKSSGPQFLILIVCILEQDVVEFDWSQCSKNNVYSE
ncbi:hypothetical protein K438DRAFT_1782813 [Mycena galopus ATCC 62051]|nr:hypothetical protein K438DRAFT_1782813 [Mycena galopus ATCC 62051]